MNNTKIINDLVKELNAQCNYINGYYTDYGYYNTACTKCSWSESDFDEYPFTKRMTCCKCRHTTKNICNNCNTILQKHKIKHMIETNSINDILEKTLTRLNNLEENIQNILQRLSELEKQSSN